MATDASEAEPSIKQIKLMGPAKTEFDTFMEQCIYFANLYWPDWNNNENPSSYIIPSVFSYKHMDVSDEVAQIVQEREALRRIEGVSNTTSRDHVLTHRTSDVAEHIVYSAMQQLIEEKVQAPIFVVHNLNIDKNHKLISQLFPNLNEEPLRKTFEQCKREYDFLIIGPRVGIVAIEVKSSQYIGSRHFIETNNHLPEDYNKGLQQLESVDALFSTLAACAKLDSANAQIRKILFTPNLTRERYETWKDSIGNVARRIVESRTSDVHQWFTEDMDNSMVHSAKPPLYCKLRHLLESGISLSRAISEKYALLASGLRSMITFGGDLQLDTLHFSKNEAILSEHQRIMMQNPFGGGKTMKLSKHSALKPIDQTKLNYEPKLFFLSPDQQSALEGPARQFIIGAAGTGKTVVLQAKALQLLSLGEAVVVFSPACYKKQYEKLFDSCGFKNYQCLEWPHQGFEYLYTHYDEILEKMKSNFRERNSERPEPQPLCVKELLNHICEKANDVATTKLLEWMLHKNIIIDDTCDPFSDGRLPKISNTSNILFLCIAWSIMEYIGTMCPTKTAWTVLDPVYIEWTFRNPDCIETLFRTTLKELSSNGFERFRVSTLRQIMRCSESVFLSAYDAGSLAYKLHWVNGTEPILGHKIQGLQTETVSEYFDSNNAEDAIKRLREKVQETLGRLAAEGVDMANAAFVLGSVPFVPNASQYRNCRYFVNGSIPCYDFGKVSSMEWPIVIHASCHQDSNLRDIYDGTGHLKTMVTYPRYRAATRATTRFIDITVIYKGHRWSE